MADRIRFSSAKANRAELEPAIYAAFKRYFSLTRDEVDRLRRQKSVELVTSALSAADWKRLTDRLADYGLTLEQSHYVLSPPACESHPRLLTSERCPQCQEQVCGACIHLTDPPRCHRCRAKQYRRARFKHFRVSVLLMILVGVALTTYLENRRIHSWIRPLSVAIYPIAADNDFQVKDYVKTMQGSRLVDIETFLTREWQRYRPLDVLNITVTVDAPLTEAPPPPPDPSEGIASIMFWSLHLRYWTWQNTRDRPSADIRLFVLYHRPDYGRVLDHSLGLEKGRIGVVNVFGTHTAHARNQVVMAHELLHTVGASDKYDPSGQPRFPEGFPDPEQGETYPQDQAEIMAGRIAKSPGRSVLPKSLEDCMIGEFTATEMGWRVTEDEVR